MSFFFNKNHELPNHLIKFINIHKALNNRVLLQYRRNL